jgi:hypothetical protein
MMTQFKILLFTGLSLIAMQCGGLKAAEMGLIDQFCGCWNYGLEFEVGNRWDMLEQTVELDDSCCYTPALSSETRFKGVNTVLLGGRAIIENGNWVLKGIGHYGWVTDGRLDIDRVVDGKEVDGHSWDLLGGLGYAFCICDCFEVVPYVGYSGDEQHLKAKHIHIKEPSRLGEHLEREEFKASWYGPWIGFDVLYNTTICNYDLFFNSGYEFHYGHARTTVKNHYIVETEDPIFSLHSKHRNMRGQVFRFDANLMICDGWGLGLNQTFSYWENSHKDKARQHPAARHCYDRSYVSRLNWYSYAVAFSVGKVF